MSQSSAIFGALFVAYFVFITVRGELPTYAGFLLSAPQGSGTTNASAQSSNIIGSAVTALSLAG